MPDNSPKAIKLANTIDEVIEQLNQIIVESRKTESRLGYFAALYREVTIKVRDGIASNFFEDGKRMEQLDVIFANRYLEAYKLFKLNQTPTKSWLFAFQIAKIWRPLVLQHLLLGMNAHINLDLGIAAVQTNPGEQLQNLKNDFFKINDILSSLLNVVQDKIDKISPLMGLLDKIGGKTDEAIMNFSINKARDEAWEFAKELAELNVEDQKSKITSKDEKIEALAKFVVNPGWFINIFTFIIRIFETGKVSENINVLF